METVIDITWREVGEVSDRKDGRRRNRSHRGIEKSTGSGARPPAFKFLLGPSLTV